MYCMVTVVKVLCKQHTQTDSHTKADNAESQSGDNKMNVLE